jgi:hypothetical protein
MQKVKRRPFAKSTRPSGFGYFFCLWYDKENYPLTYLPTYSPTTILLISFREQAPHTNGNTATNKNEGGISNMSGLSSLPASSKNVMPSVEHITLPLLRAYHPQGMITAYVKTAVTSKTREWHLDQAGILHQLISVWALELLVPTGQASSLEAIFATHINPTIRTISIEGIGNVSLGNRRRDLLEAGTVVHWNYEQMRGTDESGQGFVQAIIESRQMTTIDGFEKSKHQHKFKRQKSRHHSSVTGDNGNHRQQKVARRNRMSLSTEQNRQYLSGLSSLSTAASASASATAAKKSRMNPTKSDPAASEPDHGSVVVSEQNNPIFLLLGATHELQQNPEYLLHLYAKRLHSALAHSDVPFPILPEWASMLWEYARCNNQVEDLAVHTYHYQERPDEKPLEEPQSSGENGQSEPLPYLPLYESAYLCRPIPGEVLYYIQRYIQRQALNPDPIPTTTSTGDVVVSAAQERNLILV